MTEIPANEKVWRIHRGEFADGKGFKDALAWGWDEAAKAQRSCVAKILESITDWEAELMKVQFDLSQLRQLHRVPERTFRRFIEVRFHQPPHVWLIHVRIGIAARMLPTASCCKEVASDLFYRHYSTFSHQFVHVKGVCPKTFWLRARLAHHIKIQSNGHQLHLRLFG